VLNLEVAVEFCQPMINKLSAVVGDDCVGYMLNFEIIELGNHDGNYVVVLHKHRVFHLILPR